VFQPVLFIALVVISITQAAAGSFTRDTLTLYAVGVPFMVSGLWIDFKLFGKINDKTFRKTVLVLLLFAGFVVDRVDAGRDLSRGNRARRRMIRPHRNRRDAVQLEHQSWI
jgi:hypothetical protein